MYNPEDKTQTSPLVEHIFFCFRDSGVTTYIEYEKKKHSRTDRYIVVAYVYGDDKLVTHVGRYNDSGVTGMTRGRRMMAGRQRRSLSEVVELAGAGTLLMRFEWNSTNRKSVDSGRSWASLWWMSRMTKLPESRFLVVVYLHQVVIAVCSALSGGRQV